MVKYKAMIVWNTHIMTVQYIQQMIKYRDKTTQDIVVGEYCDVMKSWGLHSNSGVHIFIYFEFHFKCYVFGLL